MVEIKLIKDVFSDPSNAYFFVLIVRFLDMDTQTYSAASLATDYFTGKSGYKICSPLMLNLLGESSTVDATTSSNIFVILRNRFGEKWRRLYATTRADYNPIHNYDMSEQEHRELSGTKKDTRTPNLTNSGEDMENATASGYIYGFNSGDASPSNKSVADTTGTSNSTLTGTDVNDGINSETEDITRTRSGNIGVTTTQAMLQQERELWNWSFIEQMYKDIDSILTLRIYDSCRV